MHIRKRVDADNTALVDLWERSVRATHDFLSEADIVELYHRSATCTCRPSRSGCWSTTTAWPRASSA